MNVFYEGTWGTAPHRYACTALPVMPQRLRWYGGEWFLPAVYACAQGLVFDLFLSVPQEAYRAFFHKWAALTEEELEAREEAVQGENPLEKPVQYRMTVNGRALSEYEGSGSAWIPGLEEEGAACTDGASIPDLLEEYGLSSENPDRAWHHMRVQMPWATKRRPKEIRSMTLELMPQERLLAVPAEFRVPGTGAARREIPLELPEGGTVCLCIEGSEAETLPESMHRESGAYRWPRGFSALRYTVAPPVPAGFRLQLRDAGPGDSPVYIGEHGRSAPYMAGAVGVILRGNPEDPVCCAASSAYFEVPEEVNWQVQLYGTTETPTEISLLP